MLGGRCGLELARWAVKITIIVFITSGDCLEVQGVGGVGASGAGMKGHVVLDCFVVLDYKPLTISIII